MYANAQKSDFTKLLYFQSSRNFEFVSELIDRID